MNVYVSSILRKNEDSEQKESVRGEDSLCKP